MIDKNESTSPINLPKRKKVELVLYSLIVLLAVCFFIATYDRAMDTAYEFGSNIYYMLFEHKW